MPYQQSDESLRLSVERYQQRIFALALYLVGGNREKAYDVAASSLAEALRTASPFETEGIVLVRSASGAIKKSRDINTIPFSDDSDFIDFPPEKRATLRMIRTALQALPLDARALLLLRDQLHLPYKDIAAVLGVSEQSARIQTTHARVQLRKEVEEVVSRGG